MGTHLYICDQGGPMTVATEEPPPRWVTCPICVANECRRCNGADLEGDADEFSEGTSARYRCDSKHERTLRVPAGEDLPESAECPECGGMLLQWTVRQ